MLRVIKPESYTAAPLLLSMLYCCTVVNGWPVLYAVDIYMLLSVMIRSKSKWITWIVPSSSPSVSSGPSHSPFKGLPSQVVFIHVVYNSALYLASCSCSVLLHILASLICIFLFSRQLVLLTNLQNVLIPFVVKKGVPGCSSKKFHSDWCQLFLSLSPFPLKVKISLPCTRTGTASALCTSILENFWTKVGLKTLFIIPSTWANFSIFVEYPCHFHRKFHNRDI